jgi:muramoyltetrapeptide carboxypeptidase
MKRKIPPYLRKGDTIGIVVPAGYMPAEKMETCIATLENWGYHIKLGKTTHSTSETFFSGTDEERLNDLQQMLDDDEVQAILCARGGYGITRIIDSINFKKYRKKPKWIIGYSDITVLHSHLYSNFRITSLHAPMAAAFNDGEAENDYIRSLKNALEGVATEYEVSPHEYNNIGKCKGELVGGNLSLLAHIIGTSSDIETKNKILFLEDIGEYTYNIDRMLYQLKRAGKFDQLKGLIIGGFTDTKDTERPFGKTAYEIIHDIVKDYTFPICFNFPVSHSRENYALKIGVAHQLNVTEGYVSVKEV